MVCWFLFRRQTHQPRVDSPQVLISPHRGRRHWGGPLSPGRGRARDQHQEGTCRLAAVTPGR
jgi:hypothetical protein